MSFSLYFSISGLIFTILFSIIIFYIYELCPITKINEFLKPSKETVFNKIGICILPIIVWGYVELIAIGNIKYFLLGIALNIILNCSISYIAIYGKQIITDHESNLFSVVTIVIASISGYIVNYMTLLIGGSGKILDSIIGLSLILILFILIKVIKPNILIFKDNKK